MSPDRDARQNLQILGRIWHSIKFNLLKGDKRRNESYLSWKADIVTKARNHRTEETWLINLNSGISSFFVTRLVGVSMYPSMHSGITRVYVIIRTSLMGIASWCHSDIPLYTAEFSITWLYGWAINWKACRKRAIEWSLRAFASMRALRFILRAQAVIKFALRAAST